MQGQYPPVALSHLPVLLTNVHPMPFPPHAMPPFMVASVSSIPNFVTATMMTPINCMPAGFGFFGNGINTIIPNNFVVSHNIVASGVMAHPLHVHAGATTTIPSTSFYTNMTSAPAPAPAPAYYIIGGTTSNNNVAAILGRRVSIEHGHILPELAETAFMIQDYDTTNANYNIDGQQEQRMDLEDGQQEEQRPVDQLLPNHPLEAVDGISDGAVASDGAAVNNVGGDSYDANWDEFELPDEPWMSKFWEDILGDNPASVFA